MALGVLPFSVFQNLILTAENWRKLKKKLDFFNNMTKFDDT